jgi:hypothetical protein
MEQQQEAKTALDPALQMAEVMQQDSSSKMTLPAKSLTSQTAVAAATVIAAAAVRATMTAAQTKMRNLVSRE